MDDLALDPGEQLPIRTEAAGRTFELGRTVAWAGQLAEGVTSWPCSGLKIDPEDDHPNRTADRDRAAIRAKTCRPDCQARPEFDGAKLGPCPHAPEPDAAAPIRGHQESAVGAERDIMGGADEPV